MKKQVILIHGGDTYDTYEEYLTDLGAKKREADDFLAGEEQRWKDWMSEALGLDYEIFYPEMPNWMNARYVEWKIWFEKVLEHVRPNAIYVGHSLGGIFLAKYFAENSDRDAAAIFLISSPFAVQGEKGMSDFLLPKDMSRLAKLGTKVHLYHAEDDEVVSFEDLGRYKNELPDAQVKTFKTGGHFRMAEFPELVEAIKSL